MDRQTMTSPRPSNRIGFERGIDVYIMAIDGTWRRRATMEDVSATGVRLMIEGSIEKLNMKEFFLVLSSTGLAFRRCELAWIKGDQIGASFLVKSARKKPGKTPRHAESLE